MLIPEGGGEKAIGLLEDFEEFELLNPLHLFENWIFLGNLSFSGIGAVGRIFFFSFSFTLVTGLEGP